MTALAAVPTEAGNQVAHKRVVLVVEDTPDIQKCLVRILQIYGHIPTATDSVAGSIALLEQNNYDWIILDLMLIDGNGIEVLKWVQTHKPKIKVVVCSGQYNCEEVLALCPTAFLPKPCYPDALLALIAT